MRTHINDPRSSGGVISAPDSQIIPQASTKASLLIRLKEVRLAIEEWQLSTKRQDTAPELTRKAPQSKVGPESDQLATAFIAHLSEAQETLLEASDLIQTAIKTSNEKTLDC